MLSSLLALALILVLAPLLPGIAARTKAALTGRRGAPVTQLYRDLAKLLRKGTVLSHTISWSFAMAPAFGVAAGIVAACLLPLDGRRALLSFGGDLVAFAYLLALARFLLVLAALDTGSSFEGMGASREVTVASFAEPVLFACFVALATLTGSSSLAAMLGAPLAAAWQESAPALVMIATTLFAVLLAEGARGPVDDPATHLELTMIHEVMVLDHAGPDLAFVLYGAALKLALFGTLVVSVLVPRGAASPAGAIALLVAGLVGVTAAVGTVEATMARLRLGRIPQFLVAAGVLAALAVVLILNV